MPHEVIMPALGMSQDTGQIVAWLKKPGDPVKAGEALMEVETDKATMEVEAAADGFLTDVRAAEGDNVPVGDVVATISETAEGAGEAPASGQSPAKADAPDQPAEDADADTEAPVEGKQVIMPALGMSQDSGKIVAWTKTAGDEVNASDVLLEVETDKATMEVEAGHDGWLAETRGREGEDIPVGEVIAIISSTKPEKARSLGRSEAPAAVEKPAQKPAASEMETPAAQPKSQPQPRKSEPSAARSQHEGRVLASPKARRLAAERGLDLSRLVEAGYEPPFHVADLDTLAALPSQETARTATSATTVNRIEAEVPFEGLQAFCDWSTSEGTRVDPARAIGAFASAALREKTGHETAIHLRVTRPGTTAATHCDLDRRPLTSPAEAADATADLVLRDLTGSRVTSASRDAAAPIVLTVGRRGAACALTLDYDPARLDPDAAIAVLDAVAERIDEPLRHLL